MSDYAIILSTHYAGKQWSLSGISYDGLVWYSDTQKPTQAELDALWESTQATIAQQQQAQATAKASALAKLTALGLSEDEVKALVG